MKVLYSILLIVCFFSGCKKGEEDPSISFRSRKARLCNTWQLDSGSDTLLRWGGPNYFRSYKDGFAILNNLDWNQIFITRCEAVVTFANNNQYTFDFKYTDTSINHVVHTIETGKWSLLNKDDEFKNNEQIFLLPNSIKTSNNGPPITDSVLVNNFGTKWQIVGLWNDKLHIKSIIKYKSTYFQNSLDYTFKPK